MELMTPLALSDLIHFYRMGFPANVLLPLLFVGAFCLQLFVLNRGGKSSRTVLMKFAAVVIVLSEISNQMDPSEMSVVFLIGLYAALSILMGSAVGTVVGALSGRKKKK